MSTNDRPGILRLTAGDAAVEVDAVAGGRVAAITVRGHDLLVGREHDPMQWGSYPMVPFAGRIRHGVFGFDGVRHQLPINLGAHAIHGYGFSDPWETVADDTIAWTMRPPWPWPGRVTQHVALDDVSVTVTMTVTAHERQPVMVGWHPWFHRRLAAGHELRFEMPQARMYERDGEGIPTGRLVEVPEGPWDDCFTELESDPVLRWETPAHDDDVIVTVSSTCDHWVVYSMPEHALCVEPQSDAPDAVNRVPEVVDEGDSLVHSMTLRWGSTE